MKVKKFVLIVLLLSFCFSYSQVTNEGNPKSWDLNLSTDIEEKILPPFDIQSLKDEDSQNEGKSGIPWRFGYSHTVDYGFDDGQWTILENGDRIWRILISSPGAISLNFIFDDFYMPKGGSLYLYSDDKSDLLGAYTSVQNQESGMLGTWLVYGEKVWLEYYEPAEVIGEGRLHLSNITHGYRNPKKKQQKDLNDSYDCNYDVDCDIGDDWAAQKDHNKKSIALVLMNNSLCSGALINDTSNSGTPYILTADHCMDSSDAITAAYLFGWISPITSCATYSNSQSGPMGMTVSGSTLRASDPDSDFALAEINQSIPPSWDRVYAGWDRSGNIPEYSVGIHHPSGDVMKVSRDNQSPAITIVNGNVNSWMIQEGAFGGWEIGITEGGSSGSPLFDPSGRIIGQLCCGSSDCSSADPLADNGQGDFYGRVDVSWTGGGSSSSRLSDWLDPTGTGELFVNAYPPISDNDLALISVDSPQNGNLTDSEQLTVTIQNGGNLDASQFDISFQVNDGAVVTETYNGTIPAGQTVSFTFNQTIDMSAVGGYIITVTVSMDGDEINNNDSITVAIDNVGGGDCPEVYSAPIMWQDSFECYDAFAIDNIGDWIIIDNDGGTTWGANAIDFTNESYVGSGIVFNYPLVAQGSGTVAWNTYEGNQGLYFFASGAGQPAVTPNDDWMISPEFNVDGVSSLQLTFWAKSITDQYGLERLSVYVNDVNTSNPDPATFVELTQSPYVEVPTEWTQYQFDLSQFEGYTTPIRIALHYQSNDAFALQMDSFKVEGTLGTFEFELDNFNYSYNPITQTLSVSSHDSLSKISMYNVLGQELLRKDLNSNSAQVDLSYFSQAIYLFKVEGSNGTNTFKLQKN